jgi:hypothetical protein
MKSSDSLLSWKEGDTWLVGCRHIYVVAQGPTLKEAFRRFCRIFTATVIERMNEDGTLGPLPAPPTEVVKEWERKARERLN